MVFHLAPHKNNTFIPQRSWFVTQQNQEKQTIHSDSRPVHTSAPPQLLPSLLPSVGRLWYFKWLLGMYSWFATQPWRNQERQTVQLYSRQPASSCHLSLRPALLKIGSHPAFCWPISRHWNLARYVVMFCNTLMQKSQKTDHLFLL